MEPGEGTEGQVHVGPMKQFIDILLFMEATKMKKYNNCVILSQLFFANGEFISHCILCNYLLYTWMLNFHQGN